MNSTVLLHHTFGTVSFESGQGFPDGDEPEWAVGEKVFGTDWYQYLN